MIYSVCASSPRAISGKFRCPAYPRLIVTKTGSEVHVFGANDKVFASA